MLAAGSADEALVDEGQPDVIRPAVFKCRSNQTDKRVCLSYNLDVNV
jgi:hypothetical protein